MAIGMAVDIPKTREQKAALRKVVLLLDEAAFHSVGTGLYLQGQIASDFLGDITDQLVRVLREL